MHPHTPESKIPSRDIRLWQAPVFQLWRSRGTIFSQKQQSAEPVEPGITLIEGLVAIVIVALTVTMITPPIMLATATRIQTRRAEQARAIAQGEVDRVRNVIERGSSDLNALPKNYAGNGKPNDPTNSPAATTIGSTYLSPTDACGSSRYPSATPVEIGTLIPVDVDGDCKYEFLMQVFRSEGFTPAGSVTPFSFQMGVRVYANYNQTSSGSPPTPLDTQQASLGLSEGGQRDKTGGKQRALAVLYTVIARNDSGKSLGEICRQTSSTVADCSKY